LHGSSGAEFGSHTVVEIHGAIDSSNQWVRSCPGFLTVGRLPGSFGSVSFIVKLLPEPGLLDRNLTEGSSWPM
jgi:hypothetical protein